MMHGKFRHLLIMIAAALALAAGPAFAVDDLGLFELDGNAVQNGTPPPDDWETLYMGGGSANVFTGINSDPAPQTIFTGGRKDIQDIPDWGWKDGSVPDKDDITNAYAAAYDDNGDLIVYFGADRIDNNGDAFLGFWFFKEEINLLPNGSFDGNHQFGDTLVLVNFPQATNAVPLIQVIEWDPTCSKADNNNPQPGDCAAANLRLVTGAEGAGAICTLGLPGDQLACAITNEEGTANAAPGGDSTAPWPYTAKDGTTGQFPFETFFEGGINLTQVIGGEACFSSFMAETRSSSSFTASLKDFVLDSFPVCAISVDKSCTNPRLNEAEDMIIYNITGTVTNDGFGTLYNINVTDSPAFDSGSLSFDADPSSLAGGASIGYSATITVPLLSNGLTDMVTATANTSSDGSGTTLTDTATADCPNLPISPALSVSKNCSSALQLLGDPTIVAVQVNVSGEVCNVGDTRIDNVSVVDDEAGTLLSGVTLNAPVIDPDTGEEIQDCESFSGMYTPSEANNMTGNPTTDPSAVYFMDTVEANGFDIFGDPVATQTDMATCPLCPPCPDCP